MRRLSGWRAFGVLSAGQAVSLVGSGMTRFALAVWAWQETGSATTMVLIALCGFAPAVLLGPFAGALVDRWGRRTALLVSDTGAALPVIALLLVDSAGELPLGLVYVAAVASGVFEAFQWPALTSAVSLLVSKERYGRANGVLGFAEAASRTVSPIAGGGLFAVGGLAPVFAVDLGSFAVGLVATLLGPPLRVSTAEGRRSVWSEAVDGFRYLIRRPPLLLLQGLLFVLHLLLPIFYVLIEPMILARNGGNAAQLGLVLGATGAGGLAGGLVMTAWGGPARRIHGVLAGNAAWCAIALTGVGLARSTLAWILLGFLAAFILPVIVGSTRSIWQVKVGPAVQGRVFAIQRMLAQVSVPMSLLVIGPVADRVAEPALRPGGSLAGTAGEVVGTGPGSGMALMMVVAGLLGVLVCLSGYLIRPVRRIESELPDHDVQPATRLRLPA